jgi:hypothetical protein
MMRGILVAAMTALAAACTTIVVEPPPASQNEKPATLAERDAIRAHVEKFWNIPASTKDASNPRIMIRVSVLPDGTVTAAWVQEGAHTMAQDPLFPALAESALKAVRAASPLPIPDDKYNQFKDFTLAFNPKFAAGR